MKTYSEAENKLNGRERRKIGNNTYLERRSDSVIAVKLHNTDVVTFHKDGKTVLNSGGWRTSTTKDRINNYSYAGIYQKNSIWYMKSGTLFHDGIVLNPNGTNDGEKATKKKDSNQNNLKEKVRNYSKTFVDKLVNREIAEPSVGDCWHCVMRDESKTPLGELVKDKDHILHHLEESYFVPSLVLRACEVFPIAPITKNIFAYAWNPAHKDEPIPEFVSSIAKRDISKALTRYIYRQLGFAS